MPDERPARLPDEWGHTVDITHELNAIIGSLNLIEATSNNELYQDYNFIDDVSNKPLSKKMAIDARTLEIEFFRRMKVYTKVPRHQANGHKVIRTKWLDIDKGDSGQPNYRSRLVGCELKLKDHRLDLFAATPPLESLRLMCSICASNQGRSNPYRLMAIDVKRAYFYAPVRREIFIEVPLEDWQPGDEMNVAKLNFILYGTRDAAQNWIEEYTKKLVDLDSQLEWRLHATSNMMKKSSS